jgi:hypothetical protein
MTPFERASWSLSGSELPPPTVGGSPSTSGGHVARLSGDGGAVNWASETFAAATVTSAAMIGRAKRKDTSLPVVRSLLNVQGALNVPTRLPRRQTPLGACIGAARRARFMLKAMAVARHLPRQTMSILWKRTQHDFSGRVLKTASSGSIAAKLSGAVQVHLSTAQTPVPVEHCPLLIPDIVCQPLLPRVAGSVGAAHALHPNRAAWLFAREPPPPITKDGLSLFDELSQLLAGIEHAGLHGGGRDVEDLRAVLDRLLVVVDEINARMIAP